MMRIGIYSNSGSTWWRVSMRNAVDLSRLLLSFAMILLIGAACSNGGPDPEPTDVDVDAGEVSDARTDGPTDLGGELDVTEPDDKIGEIPDVPPAEGIEVDDEKEDPDDGGGGDDKIEPDQKVLCLLSCQTADDCADYYDDLTVCEELKCVPDDGCLDDEDPENDKQCIKEHIAECCTEETVEDDCDDDNICTDQVCVDNVCTYPKADPLPDECCLNQVLLDLDFDDCKMPPVDKVTQLDGQLQDSINWTVQEGKCGDMFGCAVYLGDPECKNYYSGQMSDCTLVTDMECTEETQDQDCPPPLELCGPNGKCVPDFYSKQVSVDLIAPEVLPADDGLTWLSFRLWMDAEFVPEDTIYGFDTMTVYARDSNMVEVELWSTKEIENSTNGECILVGANLSKWAGQAIDIIWRFDSVDGNENSQEGIYIDDIRVETYCDTDTCLNTPACDDDDECTIDTCVLFENEDAGGVCLNFKPDPYCVECVDVKKCEGEGPKPNDPFCFPPTCVIAPGKIKGFCQWPPNPNCCAEDTLDEYFDEGLEGGELPEGFVLEEQPGSSVKWQLVEAGCNEAPDVPDFDSFSLYFGEPEGDEEEWNYDCGLNQCYGSVSTPEIDLTEADEKAFVKLTFWLKLGTEWDDVDQSDYKSQVNIDWLTVEAVEEGAEPKEVWTSHPIFGSTHGECLPMWADLTQWAGKKISVRFTFNTGDVQPPANNFFGALIDEINVTTVCEEICMVDGDCLSGGECTAEACEDGTCNYDTKIPECCTEEGDKNCDDGDECTLDSCDLNNNTCVHDFSGDPACCTEKEGTFTEAFGEDTVDATQSDDTKWMVPVPDDKCGDGECNQEDDNETSVNCPADCNVSPPAWLISNEKFFTAAPSLHFGNPEKGTYDNGAVPAFGQVVTPAFELPPYETQTPVVSFMLWLDTEYTDTFQFVKPEKYDNLNLYVQSAASLDNPAWSAPVEVWDSMDWDIKGTTKGKWVEVKVGMAEGQYGLAGKAVRFMFEFDSADDSNNDYEGVYIDDFSVSTRCIEGYTWHVNCFSPFECEETENEPHCSIESCDQITNSCSSVPNAADPGCCAQDLLVEYHFEGPNCDIQGWTASPPGAPVKWQVREKAETACQGNCALYFGNPQTNNYNTPGKKTDGTVYAPALNVTAEDEIEISFYMWQDLDDTLYWLDIIEFGMDWAIDENSGAMGAPMTIWAKPCDATAVTGDSQCSDPQDPSPPCDELGCEIPEMEQCVKHTFVVDLTEYDWVPALDHYAVFWFSFDSMDQAGNKGEGIYVDQFQVKTTCK